MSYHAYTMSTWTVRGTARATVYPIGLIEQALLCGAVNTASPPPAISVTCWGEPSIQSFWYGCVRAEATRLLSY